MCYFVLTGSLSKGILLSKLDIIAKKNIRWRCSKNETKPLLVYIQLTHGSRCAGVICWDTIRLLGSSGSFLDPGLHLGHSRVNARVARVSTAGPKTGHTNNSVSKKNQALEVQNKYFLLYLCKSMYTCTNLPFSDRNIGPPESF